MKCYLIQFWSLCYKGLFCSGIVTLRNKVKDVLFFPLLGLLSEDYLDNWKTCAVSFKRQYLQKQI